MNGSEAHRDFWRSRDGPPHWYTSPSGAAEDKSVPFPARQAFLHNPGGRGLKRRTALFHDLVVC